MAKKPTSPQKVITFNAITCPLQHHEAVDRVSSVLIQLESILGEYPVINQAPEIKALYEKAVEDLANLLSKIRNC